MLNKHMSISKASIMLSLAAAVVLASLSGCGLKTNKAKQQN